jgi:DNA invertase Pin-like site-specific DNA recombinase
MKRVIIYCRQAIRDPEYLSTLRQAVEARGDTVVATFVDDVRITGRGKYAGWNVLISKLDQVDQVVVADAGDLPGRAVADLLKLLAVFRDRGVVLYIYSLQVDTAGANFDLLDLISAYRAAKLSAAIKAGQARALAAGKRIGRPMIPASVLIRVAACLAAGGGIRPTARRFNVSPATVINIRRTIFVSHKSQDNVAGHCANASISP